MLQRLHHRSPPSWMCQKKLVLGSTKPYKAIEFDTTFWSNVFVTKKIQKKKFIKVSKKSEHSNSDIQLCQQGYSVPENQKKTVHVAALSPLKPSVRNHATEIRISGHGQFETPPWHLIWKLLLSGKLCKNLSCLPMLAAYHHKDPRKGIYHPWHTPAFGHWLPRVQAVITEVDVTTLA